MHRVLAGVVLLAALVVGVGGAGGQATTGTLVVQVIGDGHVSATGGQIDCGQGSKRCYFTSSTSATITLTASADFVSWGGSDCSGVLQTCTFTLDPGDDVEETATFAPAATTTLTVDVTGGGGNVSGGSIDCDAGDTSCSWDVYTGSTVTLVEKPENGFDFTGWGGACSGVTVSCTVLVTSAQTVNAAFAASPSTRTLRVSATGNGTVTGGGIACTSAGGSSCTASEPSGAEVTLTATAGAGGGFTGWGGACAGASATCEVTMSSDQTVSATFTGSGSGGAPQASTFPLSISVAGDGTVSGGGLSCGAGGSTCSRNEPAGESITLTATPAGGGAFAGWSGACAGTSRTCSVTMTSAKSVAASFSGGSSAEVALTVTVSGRGSVTGGGIACGNGASACTVRQGQGSSVGLTARASAGFVFTGWGGACSGTAATCTVDLDRAKEISASFSPAGRAPASAASALASRGRAVVVRTRTGFAVTLRFRTARRGPVRVRASRAGRLEAALSFNAPAGPTSVGPFPLVKPGLYSLDLAQSGRTLHWRACLGRCGETAAHAAGPFTVARRPAAVVDAGALWSVTLRFRATQPAGADLLVFRGGRLAREVRFPARAGAEAVGPLLLTPGSYTLRLSTIDAYGRVRRLTWVALLP